MIKFQKEHLLCLAGGFVLFYRTLPEYYDGGFFALANLSAISSDPLADDWSGSDWWEKMDFASG